MDVYSRKIVGWEVCGTESAEHASVLFRKTYLREGIAGRVLILHSDNGSPMKGALSLFIVLFCLTLIFMQPLFPILHVTVISAEFIKKIAIGLIVITWLISNIRSFLDRGSI